MRQLLTVLIFTLLFSSVIAQTTQEKFGRNRIQYKQFEWRFLSSDNFDVYFYTGGEKISKEVIEFLEEEFDRITDLIGYPPYSKTKLFLYNSVADLQQSNVGVNEIGLSPGGETQFIKPYIEIAHPGSISQLKEELLYKVSALLVNEMMFGGSLKDMFQNAVLLNLPEWFIHGASLYVSKGWSIEMDDFVREHINKKNPQKLSRLTGEEAGLIGQSVWNFIAEKYGKSNISNILNYTRIIRNEEKSIAITLGVSFEQVMYEWQNYYTQVDQQVDQNYTRPLKADRLTERKNRRNLIYKNVKISPDGSKIAYSKNNNGRINVIIKDLVNDSEATVLKGGYKVIDQEFERKLPLIDWADSATLGIIYNKNGRLIFELYDLNTRSSLPRELLGFEQVESMDFSDNGRLVIVSAMSRGKNDLYLLSARRNRTKRLTNDVYDDISPAFIPNTNTIVFSSNRLTDTLSVDKGDLNPVSENYNLFFYDLDTTRNILFRATNTISRDFNPIALNVKEIFYLSDQKGITNLFKYNVEQEIYTQVTSYSSSIKNYDVNFGENIFAYVMSISGDDYVFKEDNFDYSNQNFTPLTPRQQSIQAKKFKEKRQASANEALTIEDIVEERLKKQQREVTPKGDTTINQTDEEIINTDDYTFETDVLEEASEDSFLAQYRKLRQSSAISGPFPYVPRFSAQNLVTSFLIDPLRGFGILLETDMNDMLENHVFSGGIMATTDLRSGDIFAEYKYLKARVDYNLGFERKVILRDIDITLHKYSMNTFRMGASLPFNTKTRLSVEPFYSFTRFENLNPVGSGGSFIEPIGEKYVGVKTEFVFDNSQVNGMNIIEGTRAKVSLKHFEGISDKDKSFSKVRVDIRHYQKIHREIVLAGRLFYGSSFGRSPKDFLLGGMDNWLFKKENTEGNDNPLDPTSEGDNSDLLFVEYATNMRGFDYAALFGHNTLMFNAELRIPIIRYLSSGPISSNFFRNLQFTGFFDIGSAWTGKSPFNEDNSISVKTIPETKQQRENSPFLITIKNYRNPWLYSYGAGLRTMILGYYMKFDLAWPVEDYKVSSPRLFVTLGYDF